LAAAKNPGGPSRGARTGIFSGAAFASLLLFGLPGFRRRRWPVLCLLLLLASTLAVSGCGTSSGTSNSSSSSSTTPNSPTAPQGSYTLKVTGTNTALNLSATTSFTLTVNP
jgi:hypothetical protein